MSGSQQLLLAAVQQAVATDPDFEYTTLLLPGNGTNGAQNNTFLDSSTNNFTITRNGNTTQGTFSPFSQTGWGNFFDGSGDYLSIARNSAFLPGASTDFTIEAWVYLPSVGAQGAQIIGMGEYGDRANTDWALSVDTGRTVSFYLASSNVSRTTTATIALNSWNHIAVARTGTGSDNLSIYVNGVGQNFTETGAFTHSGSSALTIGADVNGDESVINGYISNLRMINGTAVYSGATITVPTAPLTAVTNTSLLTCQSNRFVDNSTNAFAITVNGNTSIQAFSPFNPTAAWDAATYGGSGYFDGSGDYLSVARDNVFLPGANTDFTIEAWVYLTATPGATDAQILGFGEYGLNSDYVFAINSSRQLFFYFSSSNTVCTNTTTLVPLNAWTYVAVSRSGTGSNNLKVFVNGNAASFSVNSTLVGTGGNNLTIGADANGDETNLTGYITNIRFINGTGYTSLTVPTSPLTAITNTQLLTNFTNAGIYDATSKNDLETVGNAQISTTQSKFGGSSMYFDGTGDYLVPNVATSNLYAFGSGDWTVEMWVYSATNQSAMLLDWRPTSTSGAYITWYLGTGVPVLFVDAADRITGGSAIPTNEWVHLAICRASGSTKMFVNGTQSGSTYSDSNVYLNSANRPLIASNGFTIGGSPSYFTGYIDDLRITKGIARYTAAFTPPTAAFPVL